MDAKLEELRAAHDVLAEFYAEKLADALERMPHDRAVLGLFCDLVVSANVGRDVGDIGCGTGRLAPFIASRNLVPIGVDLSEEMVRVARRDHPDFAFEVADVRDLPFADAALAGAVCWYSLIFLDEGERADAFAELHRVVRPGGYLVAAYKSGMARSGAPRTLLGSACGTTCTGCHRKKSAGERRTLASSPSSGRPDQPMPTNLNPRAT